MKTRNASAKWNGDLKSGKGTINLPAISKDLNYNFSSRFEDGEGTNPEELIAAAHAGCFSMALSMLISDKGYSVENISTTAKVSIDKKEEGFAIVSSELETEAEISEIDEEEFRELAEAAKENCPVSQALSSSVEITLNAKLR